RDRSTARVDDAGVVSDGISWRQKESAGAGLHRAAVVEDQGMVGIRETFGLSVEVPKSAAVDEDVPDDEERCLMSQRRGGAEDASADSEVAGNHRCAGG